MWQRTKRLINSYLEDMIARVSSPDREVRQITRAEIARLNELEVQTRAAAKMLEKELAEVELKMVGVSERERLSRERGDEAGAASAARELVSLSTHRDFLKQQIAEANGSAAKASALREQRRVQGEDLASETHLTAMRENLAGIQSPFDATDPSATIDEMRSRISRSATANTESRVAEADRQIELDRARAQVDELLLRYKESASRRSEPPQPDAPVDTQSASPAKGEEEAEQPKTLGRTDGPMRPID